LDVAVLMMMMMISSYLYIVLSESWETWHVSACEVNRCLCLPTTCEDKPLPHQCLYSRYKCAAWTSLNMSC